MIGISYDNLRKHMVTVMTEPVVKGMENGFKLVQTLVNDGPMAAWEQLKEMAGEMQDAFIDAVKDFIKQKIIEQAIQWLVSLFIPGAGLIKAAIGIYDTIVFFIQKAKQIIEMVSNFLGSIAEIAAGNIGAAADAMEKGLARGLSLVISFLAQLLHLSGITNKIKEAIQKIRNKVDAVLLKVVKWIATQAKKLWGKIKTTAAKVVAWWKFKKSFPGADGKPHTILADRKDKRPLITVKSDEQTLAEVIKTQPQPKRGKLEIKYAEIEKLFGGAEPDEKEQQTRHDTVQKVIGEIADLLGPGELRPTVVTHAQTTGGRALRIIAEPLTPRAGNTKESRSQGVQYKELLEALVEPRKKGFTMFSSAHLLAHWLHGPAEDWNLANTGKSLNSKMKTPEGIAKEKKDKGGELKYVTTVEYYDAFPPTDRAMLAAGSPKEKLKWLGGLVAKKYTVAVSLLTPPPGSKEKPGDLGTHECADTDNFLSDLKLLGGPAPALLVDRVYTAAVANASPDGKIIGYKDLAAKMGHDNQEVLAALHELVKAGRLQKPGRFFYTK